jgi:hypothetical protein
MQRITVRLLVALLTFVIGVVITALSFLWLTPEPVLESPAAVIESPLPGTESRCFPGRSRTLSFFRRSDNSFFPRDAFSHDSKLLDGYGHWYTRELKQLDEPALLDESGTSSYRFLWIRSFHPTIAVRIWLDGERKMLYVKKLSNRKHDEPSRIMLNQARSLKPEEWATFLKHLGESCFWDMPTTSDEPIAEDGAQWVFEGFREGSYHVTHRQSPNSGSYRQLCLYLLKLSDLPLDETNGEIY